MKDVIEYLKETDWITTNDVCFHKEVEMFTDIYLNGVRQWRKMVVHFELLECEVDDVKQPGMHVEYVRDSTVVTAYDIYFTSTQEFIECIRQMEKTYRNEKGQNNC